jgi:prophage DNA circulation protein
MAEFARIRGVTKSQVTRWIRADPPMPLVQIKSRRMVPVKEASAWLAAGHKAAEVKKAGPREAGKLTLDIVEPDPLLRRQAIARTELLEANSRRALAQARRELGELVDREPMVRALQALAIAIKTELMEAPQSIADEVGAEFGIPVASVRASLDRKVRRILNNISDGIARIG